MNGILAPMMLALLPTSPAFADRITAWKVNSIDHPVVSYENPRPLIIDYQFEWNGQDIERHKLIYQPLIKKYLNIGPGNTESIEIKNSFRTFYDAIERPDGKGFILYSKTTRYEGVSRFEALELWDLSNWEARIKLEAQGTNLYFTPDKQFLVVADIPYSEGDPADKVDVRLLYFKFSDKTGKPAQTASVKMSEMAKMGFNSPLNQL